MPDPVNPPPKTPGNGDPSRKDRGPGASGSKGGAGGPRGAAPPAASRTEAPLAESPPAAVPVTEAPAAEAAPRTAPAGVPGIEARPLPTNSPAKSTRRFEPAILPIAAALVVLAVAVAFLMSSPRERAVPGATLQAENARLEAIETRVGEIETLRGRNAELERRLQAAEAATRDLAARPVADEQARGGVAGLNTALEAARSGAADGLRRMEERTAALDGRIGEETRRAEARIAQAEATLANRLTGAEQALAARVTAAEQAFGPRLAALDAALNQRVEAAGQSMAQRLEAAGRTMDERMARAEAEMSQRIGRQESALSERVQQFEARLVQAEAAERRLGALAARGQIQSALDAGRPLGQALAGLSGTAPVALARYREAAPPTESALRLSYEDAARAARLAAEPQGGTVAESALARLQGLVTVRRGDQVVVGDAVSGELERAGRSLDAGDLEGALERLERLPAPSRAAMARWIGQARDLVEARAALRALTVGAPAGGAN